MAYKKTISFIRKFLSFSVPTDYFFVSQNNKDIHNFLRNYQELGALPFENRSIKIVRLDGISTYSISFEEHQKFYNFYDSEDTTENLLNVFRHRFTPNGKKPIDKMPIFSS